MRVEQQFLTRNDCYKVGKTITPLGVMVHSTGANNPWVSRYVPGNEVLGYNTGSNHWDKPGTNKCVHAFIGKFADGSVGTVQTLPWTTRGWHAGGSANNTHISFEICEDALTDKNYFASVYQEAVELTAMLCKEYKLDPLKDGVVICHSEGHQRGVASNHADVMHWFPMHDKTMDDFRAAVAGKLKEEDEVTQEQFDKMMEDYLARKAQLPASSWATPFIEQATQKGITDGTSPQAFATREQVIAMVNAAVK